MFTGSRSGLRPEYAEEAGRLGRELVARGYGLVYGGGKVGLMTVIADSVLELKGHVTDVIPSSHRCTLRFTGRSRSTSQLRLMTSCVGSLSE